MGWSQMKKARCCHEVNIPCPHVDGVPDPQSTTTPAITQATTSLVVIPSAQTQVSQGQNMCAAAYQQCGGRNWPGATCCSDGCTCKGYSEYYSQCTPNVPGGTCVAPAASTAIFMVKEGIGNSKTLRGHVEARTSNVLRGWLLVSMSATAFLMTALVAITVHRRLVAHFRPDCDGTAPAGDSDPDLPATPQQFFSTHNQDSRWQSRTLGMFGHGFASLPGTLISAATHGTGDSPLHAHGVHEPRRLPQRWSMQPRSISFCRHSCEG